jgi:hypothetical protein
MIDALVLTVYQRGRQPKSAFGHLQIVGEEIGPETTKPGIRPGSIATLSLERLTAKAVATTL